jgi:phosphatidylserine decarboxylase
MVIYDELVMKIFDRQKNSYFEEKVYGEGAIELLWGDSFWSKTVGRVLGWLISRFSFPSALFGFWARSRQSQKKIAPFISTYGVDTSEFRDPVESFASFDAFFTRRLKEEARPIDSDPAHLIVPADGRYLFYPQASLLSTFNFKGKKWSLDWLLQDDLLAKRYQDGPIVFGRLAPPDYHWFHFPCDGTPSEAKLIPGALFSVNPRAIKKRPTIFCENKRYITRIATPGGEILMLEVGATNVGTIHETFQSNVKCSKGDPKGYFAFGGSEVILLFPPKTIEISPELCEKTKEGFETRCLLGQTLGLWKNL